MSWLSQFINSFKPKPAAPTPGPPIPAYTPPPPPQMPALPPIILNAPMPQPVAAMPSIGAGAAAGKIAVNAMQNKDGRSSTILTSKKKRKQNNMGGNTFDSYAETTLG